MNGIKLFNVLCLVCPNKKSPVIIEMESGVIYRVQKINGLPDYRTKTIIAVGDSMSAPYQSWNEDNLLKDNLGFFT